MSAGASARHDLLRRVYKQYHDAPSRVLQQQLATSGQCFNDWWRPFRDRRPEHAKVLSVLPDVLNVGRYTITPSLAERLTAASCRLEGSRANACDARIVNMHVSGGVNPAPVPDAVYAKLAHLCRREVDELYYHLHALQHAQDLVARRATFYVTEPELCGIHALLMALFPGASPGRYRTRVIHVSGWELACFPFPSELQGLMPLFTTWLRQTSECQQHPFLTACDVSVVFAHLHPFLDGNGRMARLLSSVALAHGGCRPLVLSHMSRETYQHTMYRAQHLAETSALYSTMLRHW